MKTKVALLLAVIVLLIGCASATPVLLATYTGAFGFAVSPNTMFYGDGYQFPNVGFKFDGNPQNIRFTLGFCPPSTQYSSCDLEVSRTGGMLAQIRPFDFLLPPSSISRSFAITGSTDPAFAAIVVELKTNNTQFFSVTDFDTLEIGGCFEPREGEPRLCGCDCFPTAYWNPASAPLVSPRAIVDSLVLTVGPEYLYFGDYDGMGNMWYMSGSGPGPFAYINFSVDVYGTRGPTPDPPSFLLLSSGVLGVGSF